MIVQTWEVKQAEEWWGGTPFILPWTEPLLSDEVLRRVPDVNTKQVIRQLALDALTMRGSRARRMYHLQLAAGNAIRDIDARAAVAMMNPRDKEKMLAGWKSIEATCRSAIFHESQQQELDGDMIHELMVRWILLRGDVIERIEDRHTIDGFVVEGGIIQPKPGRHP